MHVMQLVPSFEVGGMETMLVHLATWLQERGVSVEAVCFERFEPLGNVLARRGVSARRLHLFRYLWRLYPGALLRHLADRRDVVLHGHMYAWHKGAAVARWRNAACVYTQHAAKGPWLEKELREMRRSARATQAAVGVSRDICSVLVERVGFPRERVHLVPNGVPDIYRERSSPPDWRAPIRSGATLIGMVGRLAAPKDPNTLIDAVRLVRESVRDAQLVLIGSGPEEARVRERIQERGAAGYVHLLGERPDVAALLPHLDVFVLSSASEGHSIAILEAMSAARPIVATRVGGNADLLADGRCGVLTPPGEAEPMADAIGRLLRDRAVAQALATQARRRFLDSFSLDRMGEAYLSVYRNAMARAAVS
jgi:glycosyltransferase involved in cell wall biosynthesis